MSSRIINAGKTKVSREDMFVIDPHEVVFDIHENARWCPPGEQPLNHAKVVQYAREFVDPAIGQLQPIGVRPIENKRVKATYGFHRLAAAIMVKAGSPEDGIEAVRDFRIRCTLKDVNDREGFRAAIRENSSRENTTAIDAAENLRRLRTFGDDDDQIMKTLGIGKQWIKTLEKLLTLPDALKLKVHRRELPVDLAASMADMSQADRDDALAKAAPVVAQDDGGPEASPGVEATVTSRALSSEAAKKADAKHNGKINTKALRAVVRDKKRDQGKRIGLNFAETQQYLESMNLHENRNVRTIGETILHLVAGEIGTKKATGIIEDLVKVKPVRRFLDAWRDSQPRGAVGTERRSD